ncbi:MAG: hypothetical protein WB998_05960 [Solirubrobacteraceae bacterium]
MTVRLKRVLYAAMLAGSVLLSVSAPVAGAAVEAKPFGITDFSLQTTITKETLENEGKVRRFENVPYDFTQAGGHPWGLTVAGTVTSETTASGVVVPTRDPKDIVVDLPPGLLGDPQAVPRCPLTAVLSKGTPCPASTQVGEAVLHVFGTGSVLDHDLIGPIVNVTPEGGQSAEFVVENVTHIPFLLTAHLVHTAQGYGFTVVSDEIPTTVSLTGFELTFWGVPADPSHDPVRGLFCDGGVNPRDCEYTQYGGANPGRQSGGLSSDLPLVPFLTLGSDCAAGPQTASMRADSWEEPGRAVGNGVYEGYVSKEATMPGLTGCDLLQFDPSIEAQPDTLLADEPVGLGVNIKVPQVEAPETPATPHLRDAVVTLPEGMSVSPGVVDGIEACSESGPEGINFEGPESEEVGPNGELQLAAGHCPDASIVGTAEAETALLPGPVKGHVYLARPDCGGAGQAACSAHDAQDGGLYQLYLELGGTGALADTGINIKVRGKVEANPATGQLTTRFENNPQAPFSELRIRLNGGPRAPLDTPAVCGPATTTADFTPWSAPGTTPEGLVTGGTSDATPSSSFEVQGCSGAPGLKPGFSAGMVTPQAGQFSAFTLNLSRQDREQYLSGIQIHTPPGLLGMLSSVPLCGEPQAAQGTCPESSKIGTTKVASGAGSHPFEIGGNVYLTTGYKGAPFGLSIVTNAIAGPFNLGLVIVRAQIDVDPQTSQLTVTSDPLPQIVFGVPLRLQRVTVNIDRPGFMFNPTNCEAHQISAVISGNQNATASVSSPFAVGGCKSLAFKPKFAVSTNGNTTRAKGASLDVKLSYPAGSVGSEANIARVKVSLPKLLPSQLKTLQHACPAATFDVNPADCSAASVVGIVKASTPLLPVGLSGPVYFVSHGGEAFPSLIVVLQGDGVRVNLTGATFISKTGVTSSTFKTIPDVPVNSFELYLPQGKYPALAANGNLCSEQKKLLMPTEIVAQNGLILHQSTKIQVSGCKTAKVKAKRAHKASTNTRNGSVSRARTTTGYGRTH